MITRQARISLTESSDPRQVSSRLQGLAELRPQLVLVFGEAAFFAEPAGLRGLRELFPESIVTGCSCASAVSGSREKDDGIVVTAIRFERPTKVHAVAAEIGAMSESKEAGIQLGRALRERSSALKTVLLFGPAGRVNGGALAAGLQECVGRETLVVGGFSGLGQSRILLGGEAFERAAVAIGLEGDELKAHFGSGCGWDAFGLVRRVTLSSANVLFRLDGRPALDVFREYLGDLATGLPDTGMLLPISVLTENQEDTGVVLGVTGTDPSAGSVILSGELPENAVIRLMHSRHEKLIEAARLAATLSVQSQTPGLDSKGSGPALALVLSCAGRREVMGDETVEELEAVHGVFGDHAALSGFYGNSQVCPQFDVGDSTVHNQTICVVYLDE